MKTWEMIKKLTEDADREFAREDGLIISTSIDDTLLWERGYSHINLHDEWEEVKKPVDFITAVESGKDIGVQYSGLCYRGMSLPHLFYELQQGYSDKVIRQIILKGKWFIED